MEDALFWGLEQYVFIGSFVAQRDDEEKKESGALFAHFMDLPRYTGYMFK
jgi:hypothetical protein